jgi:hypothetical protein
MKKIILLPSICSLILISCKKDYTCECQITLYGVNSIQKTNIHNTKKKAKTECEEQIFKDNQTTSCSIK